jgi:hypothetical protein
MFKLLSTIKGLILGAWSAGAVEVPKKSDWDLSIKEGEYPRSNVFLGTIEALVFVAVFTVQYLILMGFLAWVLVNIPQILARLTYRKWKARR